MTDQVIKLMEENRYEEALKEISVVFKGETTAEDCIYMAEIERNLGNFLDEFLAISLGLKKDSTNYELYYMLGDYYYEVEKNLNQAYLAYENALYWIKDNENDKEVIESALKKTKEDIGCNVRNVSIVIIDDVESKEQKEQLEECIESIRDNCKDNVYEIIPVVKENKSYRECLQEGNKKACKNNDIMIMQSKHRMLRNTLFTVRMGLYLDENIACAGCTTNVDIDKLQYENQKISYYEARKKSYSQNVISDDSFMEKIKLSEECLVLKQHMRTAIDNLYDFKSLEYIFWDMTLKFVKENKKNILCKCSRIYAEQDYEIQNESYIEDKDRLSKLWGFNVQYYSYCRREIIEFFKTKNRYDEIDVLEVGCGLGETLNEIINRYPNANVMGIELMSQIVDIGKNNRNIIQGNIENMELDDIQERFDYIIFGDVLEHLVNPYDVLQKMKKLLKSEGSIITSLPNVMHYTVVQDLLEGKWDYKESGILDKTHLRFFTLNSAMKMFYELGFHVIKRSAVIIKDEKFTPLFSSIYETLEDDKKVEFLISQNIFEIKKKNR